MYSLNDTTSRKIMDQFSCFRSILRGKYKFGLSGPRHLDLCILINISVRMAGKSDGFFPVSHTGFNSLYNDRRSENRAIQNCPDGPVGAFPHFLQIVLCHSRCIWCNGSTLNSYTVFFGGFRTFHRNLIICRIPMLQTKIIIFCLKINIRQKQFVLNHFPQNSGHFVPIHFH